MTSDGACPPAVASLTALRARLTARGVPGSAVVRHRLSGAAQAGLRRIAGDRPAEELVVLGAAAALVLTAAEPAETVVLSLRGPFGRVFCQITPGRLGTVADLVLAMDAQLRSGGAAPGGAASGDRHGMSVSSEAAGAADPAGATLGLVLGPASAGGRDLTARADTAIIEPWFAAAVLRRVDHTLAGFTEPRRRLADLDAVPPPDARDTEIWSRQSFRPAADRQTLLSPVHAQAAAHPGRIAVTAGGADLSYGELIAAADRAAARLRLLGVRHGDRVAIMATKSLHVIPAILGILRAGAAYVPLDTQMPDQRLRAIMADARCALLIGSQAAGERAPAGMPYRDARDLTAPGGDAAPADLPAEPGSGDAAYVIYTSGSTGEPKGVVVRHGAIASYLAWKRGYHDLSPRTRLLQVPSLSFDSSVSDVFSVLGAGGRLVLADERIRLDAAAMGDLGTRYQITHITLVPSLYGVLAGALAGFPALHLVVVAGEAMPPALAAAHVAKMPGVRLVNEYGPTENSVGATAFDYTRPAECGPGGGPPEVGYPIGRPIDNTIVEVLDDAGRPAPVGFPGEIHLAGPGLADGYLGRPEQTGHAFRPAPQLPGGRRYATGDRAWWLPDGRLEFLGRADEQVKVRGHRVELGDIEAVLAALPGVGSAAVVAVTGQDAPATAGLAGYVTCTGRSEPAALRDVMRAALPPYMIPDRIIGLDAMPLTANGKIDRAALTARAAADLRPAADPRAAADPRVVADLRQAGTEAAGAGVAPHGAGPVHGTPDQLQPGEARAEEVARLFARTLSVAEPGPGDDFFALGGHSLLGIELLIAVEERFGVRVPVDDFFAAPTPAGLTGLIRAAPGQAGQAAAGPARAGPIPAAPPQANYPLSPAQRQFWLLDHLDQAGQARYNLVEAFWVEGGIGEAELRVAVDAEVGAHDVLHSRVIVVDGEPRVLLRPEGTAPFRVIGCPPGTDAETAAAALIEQEYSAPFDLAVDPPLRATLLQVTGDLALFVLTIHHIAADGDSSSTLVRHLLGRITAHRTGAPPPREPATRYLDYAVWAAACRTGDALSAGRAHWLDQLGDGPAFCLLPADGSRGQAASRGDHVTVTLPADTTAAVRLAARQHGVTVFSLLLASAAELLHRLTGMCIVDLGTPVSTRDHPACEAMIGPFANVVVLRVRLDPDRSFGDLLTAAQAAVRAALAHRDHPFADLAETVPGARDGGRTPLFTVMFSVDEPAAAGAWPPGEAVPGLRLRRAAHNPDASPYELALHADNSGAALRLIVGYDTILFSRGRAERIAAHWADLVARSTEAERTLAQTPLPGAEQAALGGLAARPATVLPPPAGAVPAVVTGRGVVVIGHGGRPVPIGVPGDIMLAAAAGAGDLPSGPYAATGWSGLWREDGVLQLRGPAGRIAADHAGPVDPAESEMLLRAYPGIAHAQTVAGPDGRLRARVTCFGGAPVTGAALRAHLRRFLPARLTPDPITVEYPGDAGGHEPAGDGLAAAVAAEVAAVLKLDWADPDADFFSVGGSSLTAMRVARALRLRLGRDIPPRVVFTARTPRALAAMLGPGRDGPAAGPGPSAGLAGNCAPLSAEQRQLTQALLAGVPESAFAVLECYRLADLDPAALRAAVGRVLARHGALSSRLVQDAAATGWQRLAEPRFGWRITDVAGLDPAGQAGAIGALLREHVEEPFDLRSGISVRVLVLRTGHREHLVAFALHHLVVDGHSVGLVIRQIAAEYQGTGSAPAGAGAPSALDAYAWQAARLADGSHAKHLTTWRRLLGDAAPGPALPYDRPRLTRAALMPAEASARLPASSAAAIRSLSARLRATSFMTVMAAFAVLLAGDAPAVRLATIVSMRGRPELTDTVGLLSTTAALRVDVDGHSGFSAIVTGVRDLLLDAHAAADQPFALVAEAAEREEGIDRADLARVLIVADAPPPCPEGWHRPAGLPGLTRPVATAYDLAVSVRVEESAVDCAIVYRGELFDPEAVDELFRGLRDLIGELAASPDAPLSQVRGRLAARITQPAAG